MEALKSYLLVGCTCISINIKKMEKKVWCHIIPNFKENLVYSHDIPMCMYTIYSENFM